MKKIEYILFVLIIASTACSAFGASYYVKSSGNDLLDGLSDTNAWQTVSKVNSYITANSFSPGDEVLFNRGDDFSAAADVDNILVVSDPNIGTALNPFTISSYGSGDLPIINHIKVISGAAHIRISDIQMNYNYKGSLGNSVLFLIGTHDIIVDGVTIDADSYNGGATAGSYGTAVRILPASSRDVYDITIKNSTINGSTGGGKLRGIWMSDYTACAGCLAHDLLVENCTINDTFNLGVQCSTTVHETVYNCIYRRNTVHNVHTETGLGCQGLITGWGVVGYTIIDGNYVDGSERWGIMIDSGASNVYVMNNVVYNNVFNIGSEGSADEGTSDDIYFYNNTSIEGPTTTTSGFYLVALAGGDNYVLKNNIVVGDMGGTGTTDYFLEALYGVTNISTSNNIWYNTATGVSAFYINDTAYANLAAFKAAGYDANGSNSNPLLDADYSLLSSSPAINNGVNASGIFTTDKDGYTRAGLWDIGAYEFHQGGTPWKRVTLKRITIK